MQRNTIYNIIAFLILLAGVILLIVFLPTREERTLRREARENPDMIIGEARITSVDLVTLESFPVQVQAKIQGEVGDGCTELNEPEVSKEGSTFMVRLTTSRPKDAVCTQQLEFFDLNVPIEVAGLQQGTYTVNVNGTIKTFTLSVDNQIDFDTDLK